MESQISTFTTWAIILWIKKICYQNQKEGKVENVIIFIYLFIIGKASTHLVYASTTIIVEEAIDGVSNVKKREIRVSVCGC